MTAQKNVTLTLTGAANVSSTVAEGTSLRVAMSKVGLNATNYTFADSAGKVVSLDRKLAADLNVVATAKPGVTETSGTAATTPAANANQAATASTAAADTSSTAAAEPADNANNAATAPTTEAPKNVRIVVKGKIESSFEATAGSTLRAALTKAGHSATGVSFTDATGKAVSADRKIDGDITLTSSTRTSGG